MVSYEFRLLVIHRGKKRFTEGLFLSWVFDKLRLTTAIIIDIAVKTTKNSTYNNGNSAHLVTLSLSKGNGALKERRMMNGE